jgi:hypothetical protein
MLGIEAGQANLANELQRTSLHHTRQLVQSSVHDRLLRLPFASMPQHVTDFSLSLAQLIHFAVAGSKPWAYDPKMPDMTHPDVVKYVSMWRKLDAEDGPVVMNSGLNRGVGA